MPRRYRTLAVAAIVSVAPLWAEAAEETPTFSLEGQSFDGEIWGTGILFWLSDSATFTFEDGAFSWTSGITAGYKPTPYTTTRENRIIKFTARAIRQEGDYVAWTGTYDGLILSNVTGIWTRIEKDFFHDLLLPSKVTFIFKSTQPESR